MSRQVLPDNSLRRERWENLRSHMYVPVQSPGNVAVSVPVLHACMLLDMCAETGRYCSELE